jgi:hypothetical protein
MSQITTLNQLIDKFKEFTVLHPQLNDFGFGPTSEIGNAVAMKFPYMWTSFQTNSTIKVSNNNFTPELRFYFLFMDQVSEGSLAVTENGDANTNGQEIISDTFQYLQDFLNYLATSLRSEKIKISEDINCFAAEDDTKDKVNGWVAEITLRVEHNSFTGPTGQCWSPLA